MHWSLTKALLYRSGHGSEVCEVKEGESAEVWVFPRYTAGAKFTMTDAHTKTTIADAVEIKHTGAVSDSAIPTSAPISTAHIQGPISLKVKADSNASRFYTHITICWYISSTTTRNKKSAVCSRYVGYPYFWNL